MGLSPCINLPSHGSRADARQPWAVGRNAFGVYTRFIVNPPAKLRTLTLALSQREREKQVVLTSGQIFTSDPDFQILIHEKSARKAEPIPP